jgi:hypothetical protein
MPEERISDTPGWPTANFQMMLALTGHVQVASDIDMSTMLTTAKPWVSVSGLKRSNDRLQLAVAFRRIHGFLQL